MAPSGEPHILYFIYSEDGINWNMVERHWEAFRWDRLFKGDKFIAISYPPACLAYSEDGVNWTFNKSKLINGSSEIDRKYDLLEALGINLKDILSIPNKAETATYRITLDTNWSSGLNNSYMKIVKLDGILETDTPFVDVDLENASEYNASAIIEAYEKIDRIHTKDNMIYVYCYDGEKPEIEVPIILKVVR